MSDESASNALVTTVRFYSEALARSETARRQTEQLLKQALDQLEELRSRKGPSLNNGVIAVARAAERYVAEDTGENFKLLRTAVEAHARRMGDVGPAPAREGAVRAAPADGDADVPG